MYSGTVTSYIRFFLSSQFRIGPGWRTIMGTIRRERVASVMVAGFTRSIGVLMTVVVEEDIFAAWSEPKEDDERDRMFISDCLRCVKARRVG
jgi:hypothetical protein